MNHDLLAVPQSTRSLANTLSVIQVAQLIRRAEESSTGGAETYSFKHALVQETIHASLMRQERRRLHRLVAETLEWMYPEQVSELAPRLAAHFDEAGETGRALVYFQRAAEDAAARYANREALDFYTRALDAADALQSTERSALYRARGIIYERTGESQAARSDLERALQLARANRDMLAEWQTLIELGFAWLARDYARAGDYFEPALELARASGDPGRVAHTLNRVGNWHMNNEDAQRALTYHNEALSIFESLDDTRGLADTHDLLGMSNLMGSNFAQATAQYQRALELYTALGDRRGIAAISGAIVLQAPSLQSDMLVLSAPLEPPEETLAHVRPMTQELGWRAQEAVVLWALAERFASAGSYGRAFEIAEQAIELAREIGHDQWLTAATAVHGAIFADLLDFEDARHELELALDVARRINSVHWVRVTAGFLASTLIGAHDFARAREILDEFVPPTLPATTLGQRQGWMARAELALAQNEPARAMEVLDLLLREAANLAPGRVIPRLWMLRAQALLQLDRADAAETFALEARANLEELSQPRLMWRVLAVLAQIYRSQQRKEALTNAEAAAQAIVDQLAVTVPDETLRATFLSCATKEIRGG